LFGGYSIATTVGHVKLVTVVTIAPPPPPSQSGRIFPREGGLNNSAPLIQEFVKSL